MSNTFSVSQVNEYLKMLMESSATLCDLWVVGEISNFKNHYSTGHLYFSLKDEESMIKCVMFRMNASKLRFSPKDGMRVILHGKVSNYVPRGEYQIYVDSMQPDGVGDLAVAFEQLKAKLLSEGLFDQSHKKELPKMPTRVGVITSASGAAIHDIITVSGRRCPQSEVIIYPAIVQGDQSARSLCGGIKYFNEKSLVDVIIIGRGGGSIEDLWSFNDENLARAIYNSEIPVVSAVGHETDFTICDFVSDVRAATPSAAAEIVFPDICELSVRSRQLKRTADVVIKKKVDAYHNYLEILKGRINLKSPEHILNQKMTQVALIGENIDRASRGVIEEKRRKLSVLVARLNASNPLSLTSRGYAVVQKRGLVMVKSSDLSVGDDIEISFADGKVFAKVENTQTEANNG